MRAVLSREAILDAARDLITANGIEALSLRRIAGSLGVTAPALYAHFPSKYALLQAIAEAEFTELAERLRAIDEADPVERVRRQAWVYVDYARERPQLFRTMFLFQPELTAEPRGHESPLATSTLQEGLSAVDEAITSGAFAPADPLMTGLAMWTATHGIAAVILAGPQLGRDVEDALAARVIETMLAGLQAHGDD